MIEREKKDEGERSFGGSGSGGESGKGISLILG